MYQFNQLYVPLCSVKSALWDAKRLRQILPNRNCRNGAVEVGANNTEKATPDLHGRSQGD